MNATKPTLADPRVVAAALVALLALGGAGAVHAWGQEGHRITAEVAERKLSAPAIAAVAEILGGDSLAEVATWPDEIRSYPSWDCAKPFHFVTVELGAEYPSEGVAEGDSVQALVYYSDLLRSRGRDAAADAESLRQALAFIVHLVGDIHQPLHAGRGCDRGGNQLKVGWFGDQVNFHTVWDSLLIQTENLSFDDWADFLDADDGGGLTVAELGESTPVDWVRESQRLLDGAYTCYTDADRCPCFCGVCEGGESPFGGCRSRECKPFMAAGLAQMSYGYKAVNVPIVRRQLYRGGARLASLLEWVLAADKAPPPAFAEMAERVRALSRYDPEVMRGCRGVASIARRAD